MAQLVELFVLEECERVTGEGVTEEDACAALTALLMEVVTAEETQMPATDAVAEETARLADLVTGMGSLCMKAAFGILTSPRNALATSWPSAVGASSE